VAPVIVRTIAYRPPEQQIVRDGRAIASVVVVIGFSIVIAGMFWPMRRRRESALSQIDLLSIFIPEKHMRTS